MLKIEKPDRLNSSMKALTAGVDFELVYQRENPNEYLFRILRDGVLDAKMAISKDWNKGDTVIIRFADKDNHWVMATYELDFDVVRNRSHNNFKIDYTTKISIVRLHGSTLGPGTLLYRFLYEGYDTENWGSHLDFKEMSFVLESFEAIVKRIPR